MFLKTVLHPYRKPLTVASDTPNISPLAESTILTPDLLRGVKVENDAMMLRMRCIPPLAAVPKPVRPVL